jgi:hypothetical protein
MGWCVLGLAGTDCDAKQEVEKIFNMEAVNKNIFETVSKNSQKVSATNTTLASLVIEIEKMNPGCPVNVAQSIKSETISDATQVIENISTMATEVTNALTNSAEDTLESTSGFLSLSPGAKQNLSAEMNTSIENVVDRTFSVENVQEVAAASVAIAEGKIIIKECNAPIDITQDIVASTISTAVMDNLVDNLVNDTTINDVLNRLDTTVKQENTGIFQGFGEMFKRAFAGDAKWVWIGLSIAICVLLIVVMRVALSEGGQNAMKSAAASR